MIPCLCMFVRFFLSNNGAPFAHTARRRVVPGSACRWRLGIDINLGCPQRRAREGNYGAWLANEEKNWPLIGEMLKECVQPLGERRGWG